MTRRIRHSRIVVIATAVITLAACASDGGSSGSATTSAASSATPTTDAALTSAPSTDAPNTDAPSASDAPTSTTPVSLDPNAPPRMTIADLLALDRPIVLAHAAGEDDHPHSSPYGYARSVAAGVDMLDMDVQLSADGVLIVHHDDTVDRTTEATGLVAEMTYAELAALDNAYWFSDECTCTGQPDDAYRLRGVRTGETPPPDGAEPDDFAIARFRDLALRFPTLPLNIEIKGEGQAALATAEALAAELTQLELLDNVVVASFEDGIVHAFGELAPSVELSPGLGASTSWVIGRTPLPDGMRILQLPPRFGPMEVLNETVISDAHAAGYLLWVWPNDRELENADAYADFLAQGLDGLNVNRPSIGVDVVAGFTPD